MAKVLACPSCGHKHSLEDIDSSDEFDCQECAKTLSVPENAKQYMKNDVIAKRIEEELVEEPEISKHEDQQAIVVVARSSLEGRPVDQSEPETLSEEGMQVVGKSGSLKESQPISSQPTSSAKSTLPTKSSERTPSLKHPISLMGKVITWLIAVPAGFIAVVIAPRILGFGFHASDFVGVITTQGFGRFKIVFLLILLWSIATCLALPVLQIIWQRLFRSRRAVS